ncbi:TRM11 family SAM-dependent methyltransferase [Litchfieldia alkalitelluris]|uniref:TRM11 family SAM-dependent methyltransferase n=1 Tax=Litchfieldia alkalitelluris TaxID=304268 RepID=UPI001F23149F|nr:RNA methyltransferase [Litchfieldia alkalitelluris]
MNNNKKPSYLYQYACREDEKQLAALEMRSFFGQDSDDSMIVESHVKIDPSRSPFIRERVEIMYEGSKIEDIVEQVKQIKLENTTFKVMFIKSSDLEKKKEFGLKQRRKIEKEVGLSIDGEPDLLEPQVFYGIMNVNWRWVFGHYEKNDATWLRHQTKPHSYSTALSTRVARAVANIAVPDPRGIKAIDPCCGIGTVLVEAISMGIDIVGSDVNHLILPGTRENIAYFGLEGEVKCKDIREVTEKYDVAIIDMPYNLCSVITPDEQLEMFQSAWRFSNKLVIVTLEPIDGVIIEAGFKIIDRCVVNKGAFTRQIIVCEKVNC